MKEKAPRALAAAVLLFAGLLAGCGGGGSSSSSSSSASSLTIAEKVSVVDTSSSGGASLASLKINTRAIDPNALPAGSNYASDTTRVFVEERSAESFDIINEILCSLGQARYDQMLNAGDYKAQIDLAQCDSGNDSASKAGQGSKNQSSGSNQPDYEIWTLNSSRADATSPQIVKAWIHEQANGDGEPEKVIFTRLTITEGTSATNPYGLFTLYFKAHPVSGGSVDTSKTFFRGFLKSEVDATGKVLLKFIADGGFDINSDNVNDISFTERVTLDRSLDGLTGGGSAALSESNPGGSDTKSFNFVFNQANFLRRDASNTDVCLSRTTFDETAHRYGLYNSSGARVNLSSGFPVKYSSGGTDYHGWIGYWGLWFPRDVTVPNGATVYKMTYGPNASETPYTINKVGGKLKKYTKKSLTLAEISGVPLQFFDQSTNTDYQIEWDGSAFVKTATLNKTSWLWENLSPQQTFDLTALNFSELYFWSNALGGNVQVKLTGCTFNNVTNKFSCTASGSSSVVFYMENTVYPSDTVPSTLACFENCPNPAGITGANPFFDTSSYQTQNMLPTDPALQYVSYTFSTADMTLKSGGSSVLLPAANSAYSWGVMSGALFEPTAANLNQLACDWNSSVTCAWQARSNLTAFYVWETGNNDWNQFTALYSGGTYLTFDQPLSVKYSRTVGATTSTYYLQYGGFGELWGIPGKCINRDTGADTACGPDTRWIPEFSIPAGTTLVSGSDNTTEYLVKPLEKEQRMSAVAASNCSSLTITSYTLPDMADFVDPAIGSEPAVTAAPAVIGGVLQ